MLTLRYAALAALLLLGLAMPGAAQNAPAVNSTLASCTSGGAVYYNATNTLGCKPAATVVGSLPTCDSTLAGASFFVTDGLTPVSLATAVGGGAVGVRVTCAAVSGVYAWKVM